MDACARLWITIRAYLSSGIAPPTWCSGRRVDVKRMMLCSNALKFSEREKRVRVRVGAEGGCVRLTVTDHGRGFAPEMGPEVLRPFTIANVMHHSQGTGLNLALASAIVASYGGKLSAASRGVNQGATFTVELPEVSLL